MLTVPMQTLENPNEVAHKGSVVNWVRFVKWTKGTSADDTTTMHAVRRIGIIMSSRDNPRTSLPQRFRVQAFGTNGRAPGSFVKRRGGVNFLLDPRRTFSRLSPDRNASED